MQICSISCTKSCPICAAETQYPDNMALVFIYSAFVKGDQTYFDVESSGGVEGTSYTLALSTPQLANILTLFFENQCMLKLISYIYWLVSRLRACVCLPLYKF